MPGLLLASIGTARRLPATLGLMPTQRTLDAAPGSLSLVGASATARVVANFAWQHLKAACTFRDQVVILEAKHSGQPFGAFFEEIRSYASACLMSSVSSLEALINELYIAHNCRLRQQFSDFEVQFWGKKGVERKPILDKYQLALDLLGAHRQSEHAGPYRDAWALIELRNALIHYKPTWDPERQRTVDLIEVLDGQFSLSPFPDAGADFVSMKCMSAGCARWAVDTVFSFIRQFDSRTALDPGKMAGFWNLET